MNATEIRRTEFTEVTDERLRERAELAREAKRLLSYKRLALQVREGGLLEALKRLDIHPLVESSVLEYQRSKMRRGIWRGQKVGFGLLVASLATGWLMSLAGHYGHIAPSGSTREISMIVGLIVCGAATVILQVSGWSGVLGWWASDRRITLNWAKAQLYEYPGVVPEYVLRKAIEIKKAHPDTNFVVVYLEQKEEEIVRRLPDPFLVALVDGESYYIDVWDEREFESKL